jgi:two-component system response regulator HydG
VFRAIEKVAPTETTVFIRGESGTGKELVARALHDLSARREQPFVAVNCAAIPATLLESELFGHEQGAFTGALKRKLGRFELAQGGTLFLDEIGDLPLAMQAKLLRALQQKTIERVGGETSIHVDVRIVSATHRDIHKMVNDGTFREDLLYRLHIIPIDLPPLRERTEDIPPLVDHFLRKLSPRTGTRVRSIDAGCLAALQNYRWPGNVRELENVIEQALVFADGDVLHADDLPAMLGALKPSAAPPLAALPPVDDPRTLDEVLEGLEKALILRAYEAAGGVKTETARRLGIKTSALYYKLQKYKIDSSLD